MDHIEEYELFEYRKPSTHKKIIRTSLVDPLWVNRIPTTRSYRQNLYNQQIVSSPYDLRDIPTRKDRPETSNSVHAFFKNLEAKFAAIGRSGQSVDFKAGDNNYGTNAAASGLSYLLGMGASLISGILAKIFDPKNLISKIKDKKIKEKYKNLPVPKTEKDITIQHKNLFLDDFEANHLSKIKTKEEMEKYILDFYKNAGIKPGVSQNVDQVAAHEVAMFMNKNPNNV